MSKFSETLIYLRKRDGLSQQDLADKIGMSRSVVGMYEAGQRMPSIEVLEALADTFNVNADFLIGRSDSGESLRIFRDNLAQIIESRSQRDIEAAGIDMYEVNLIINGTIPLSFDHACQLADQLGESLDAMLGKEEPAIEDDGGLQEMTRLFTGLSSENRSKLLELSRLYLSAQHNS